MSAFTTGTRALAALLAAVLVIGGAGCDTGSSIKVLSRPQWVCPPPLITASMDSAGFASPEDLYIHLHWYIGPDENLAGYDIFRQTEGDIVDTLYATHYLSRDELANPSVPVHWVDRRPVADVMNYYVIYSFDSDGNRSARSDTVGYNLIGKAALVSPIEGATTSRSRPQLRFSLGQASGQRAIHYFIRVEEQAGATYRTTWISGLQPLLAYDPYWVYVWEYGRGAEGAYTLDGYEELPPGAYRWRVDLEGDSTGRPDYPCDCIFDQRYSDADPADHEHTEYPFAGSRSEWGYFNVTQ